MSRKWLRASLTHSAGDIDWLDSEKIIDINRTDLVKVSSINSVLMSSGSIDWCVTVCMWSYLLWGVLTWKVHCTSQHSPKLLKPTRFQFAVLIYLTTCIYLNSLTLTQYVYTVLIYLTHSHTCIYRSKLSHSHTTCIHRSNLSYTLTHIYTPL